MKTFSIDTKVLDRAAKVAGLTPEKFLSRFRSLQLGRRVYAHHRKTVGSKAVFVL